MYKPIRNGTTKTIGWDGITYEVHLPPVGYVYDKFTNELLKTNILFSDKPKKEQKWVRQEMPLELRKRVHQEIKKQKVNPNYIDDELEKYRKQEWFRRINGVWISINGKPIYITGLNYFYLNYYQCDFGYPDFRYTDVEVFYFIEWNNENPNSYGINLLGGRRSGKTAKMGVFLLEPTIRNYRFYSGFQSKEEEDAKRIFNLNIKDPFIRLPSFFIPNYDFKKKLIKEIVLKNPMKEIETKDDLECYDEGLNSWILYKEGGELAFDGMKLHRYGRDEGGKLEKVDVYSGWLKTKYCLWENGKIIGKAYFGTTIEELGNNANPYFKLFDDSNPHLPNSLKKNGQTVSGLFSFFVPADMTYAFDEYGFAKVEENRKEILANRENLTDIGKLMEECRKFPLTIQEAKSVSKTTNPFNNTILTNRRNALINMAKPPYRIGNFYWIEKYKKVGFSDDELNGRWHISWLPDSNIQTITDRGMGFGEERFIPLLDDKIHIGLDPTAQGSTATTKLKSSVGMTVFRRFDPSDLIHSETFVCDYLYRPDDPNEFMDDVALTIFAYGGRVLIERKNFDIRNYMYREGFKLMVDKKPLNTSENKYSETHEEGLAPTNEVINFQINLWKKHIVQHGDRLCHTRIIEQALNYTPDLRTRFDLICAGGHSLVAADAPYQPIVSKSTIDWMRLISNSF